MKRWRFWTNRWSRCKSTARGIANGSLPQPSHSANQFTLHFCCQAHQGLLRVCLGKAQNTSNITQQAIKASIPNPRLLSLDQCLDGIEACSWKLKWLQIHAHGLRKVHLCNCFIQAQDDRNKEQYKGILRRVEREEQKSIWKWINRATNEPKLGAIPKVQRMEGL